ncbi:MAG TPA: hypothetical protein VLM91_24160 [Candidatus Methylomirabilis sp.]|nr:hypothetical protein [Candidatus Methylomirabilis sp.]
MNVQIFVEPVARHQELAAAMNAWLAEHPRLQIEEEAVQFFHNHCTNADDVLVMMFYTEQLEKEKKPRRPESKGS